MASIEKEPKKNICPSLYILGGHGKFRLDFNREAKGNRLVVSNIEPGEKGGRLCRLGFMTGKKGFNLEVPHGKYIHLMAEVDFPGPLVNKDNRLFIQDFDGRWERESVTFSGTGRLVYLVSKKIRPSSTKAALGIQFVPQSAEDKLLTGNIRVFVSGDAE